MHKTVSASIGSALLTVEEGAYARLDAYLKAIRAHFAATPDADEIVSDIEDRIAEELSETLSARKKVILMKDVEAVIRSMGTVEDFKAFEGETKEQGGEAGKTEDESGSWKHVRLYRDADDKFIGGVCAGIANYFGIDPLLVRLAFGLSLFAGGFGAVLYILLWIVLPEARTTAQKVEMTGGRVTLQAIQERIDEHLPPEQRRSALRKILALPVIVVGGVLRVVGTVLRFVLPLLARLAGAIILIAASFAIAMATVAAFSVLLNPSSPYIGLPLREIAGAGSFAVLLLGSYFVVLIPLIFVLLLGASLVSLRNVFSWPAMGGLLGNWLLALVVLGVAGFTAGPRIEAGMERWRSEHEGVTRRTVAAADFRGIDVGGNILLRVRRGTGTSVSVSEPEGDEGLVTAEVRDGTLYLTRATGERDHCILFCRQYGPEAEITVPALSSLQTFDVARAFAEGMSGDVRLAARDASRISAEVRGAVQVAASDVARIELRGSGTTLLIDGRDASRVDATAFAARDVTATLKDVARADVTASGALRGSLSDASRLSYEGNPATVEVDTSDVARVDGPHEEPSPWEEGLDAEENLR